jgi:hypothetical protein
MRLTYWTAKPGTPPLTQIFTATGTTAAAATPTICRMGVYSIASNGNGTLVAAITNDTTLFAATSTEYIRTLTTPASGVFSPVAGQRYANAILVVTAVAAPTIISCVMPSAATAARPPLLTATLTGQADLPASFTSGSLASSTFAPYIALIP